MKNQPSEKPEQTLIDCLAKIDKKVVDWVIAEPDKDAHAVIELTNCVNKIASDHAVLGAAFSVLEAQRPTTVLINRYSGNMLGNVPKGNDSLRLFPYKLEHGIQKKFPRLKKALENAGEDFSTFIDNAFQVHRSTNNRDFLSKNLKFAELVEYEEILDYLAGWLYSLFCAANDNLGLNGTKAKPQKFDMSIGDAFLDALKNTPTKRLNNSSHSDFFLNFKDLTNKTIFERNKNFQLLMDCKLDDIFQNDTGATDFSLRASKFFLHTKINSTVPFGNLLDDISKKARFPLFPYLCLVPLFQKHIAHVAIPMHHTRSFKHDISDSGTESEKRNCGVYFLATVDNSKVNVPMLGVLAKAMAAPILDQVYHGNFQKSLAERSGAGLVQASFGHQVKTMGQFYNYWLLNGPAPHGENIRWTPMPELFEDLGETLKFWSFGNSHEDIGIINKTDAPESFKALLEHAVKYANRKEKAIYFSSKDLSCETTQNKIKSMRPITLIFGRDCQHLEVDKNNLNTKETEKQSWKELAGLCRFFSVQFENSFEHRKNKNKMQEVQITIKTIGNNRLSVVLTNSCAEPIQSTKNSQDKQLRFSGVRGKRILEFIKDNSLASLDVKYEISYVNKNLFKTSLEMEKPRWMNWKS